MGEPRKVIRDYRFEPDKALAARKAVIAAEQARYRDDPRLIVDGGHRVVPPYYPREPINAGDEMSPGGTQVTLEELAPDVLAALAAGGGSDFDVDKIITDNLSFVVVNNAGNVVVRS